LDVRQNRRSGSKGVKRRSNKKYGEGKDVETQGGESEEEQNNEKRENKETKTKKTKKTKKR
jgi:hypothetical protein